jgi:N-acetylmuramoyl-L-alanine amidase
MARELRPEQIAYLILHCSDSPWGDVDEFSRWHRARGFDFAGGTYCGYHFLILNGFRSYRQLKDGQRSAEDDGTIQIARPACYWGAHALGYNDRSLGICLVGVRDFTAAQRHTLRRLVLELMDEHHVPVDRVLGHAETALSGGKTCPNFDVPAFRRSLAAPQEYPLP